MLSLPEVESNLSQIQERIQHSAKQSGRSSNEIQVVAVTKGFPSTIWDNALQLSLSCIGESRIQEISSKNSTFFNRNKIELHLIGRLQSNKARKAVELTDVIQTVDSLKLANRLNIIAGENDKKQRVYLQVNTGMDPKKTGFTSEEVLPTAEKIAECQHLYLEGVMTIPPYGLSKDKLHNLYAETRKIRNHIQQNIMPGCISLSMGMSDDYETAITEGATHIRLGTALFGPRPPQEC